MLGSFLSLPELFILGLLGIFILAVLMVLRLLWTQRRKARAYGYPSLSAYLRAAPRTDDERKDAADLALGWGSFDEYLQRVDGCRPALNLAALVGHGTLRQAAGASTLAEYPTAHVLLTGVAEEAELIDNAIAIVRTAAALASAATGTPPTTRATCTAQSSRGTSANSRVPSRGSTIHTRAAVSRAGSAAPSSDSTASSGRAAASRSISSSWAAASPASPRALPPAPSPARWARSRTRSSPASVARVAASR